MSEPPPSTPTDPAPDEGALFWLMLLGIVLLHLVVIAALAAGPVYLSVRVNPWLGVIASVGPLVIWARYGPRPMPGFLPGILAVNGFLMLLAVLLVLLLRALGL